MPISKLDSFELFHLQILDEDGKVDADLEPDLSEDELISYYRAMCLSRAADDRMLKLQRQGRLGTFGPATGQEASNCGPVFAMREKDWFVGAFREIGGRLMRGIKLSRILQFWNGYEEGSAISRELRTLPDSVIVAAQIPQAVGLAWATRYQGEKDTATICYFGDGATSEGDFHEGLNFAGVWKAPVVFICQNNQWAISVPRSKQTASRSIAQKALAYGIHGIQVDGNDPLAMYVASKEALDRARAGEGATLIEAVTYRMMMHTTADDPRRYRSDETTEEWRAKDPLKRFRSYLEAKGIWDEDRQKAMDEAIAAEIAAEVEEFEAIEEPALDAPFDFVFAESHPYIEKQRAEFLARRAREVNDA